MPRLATGLERDSMEPILTFSIDQVIFCSAHDADIDMALVDEGSDQILVMRNQ